MKMKIKSYFWLLLFFLICSHSYGQINQYDYKRELNGISEQWHKVILPNDIFGKVSQNLSDIRIFGIKENNDTIEAPYLLRLMNEKRSSKEVAFKILNTSYNKNGYYFTFEIPSREPINQVKLKFKQKNFDWRVKIEGSQNQKEWFTVTENYRILSIKNDITDFQFTKLTFPSSRYRFFRLLIDSKEKPDLKVASISEQEVANGLLRHYPIKKIDTKENKQSKQTEIAVGLQLPVPVSNIKINILDSFDYYRPMTIKYVTDSFKTENGWKYNYRTLTSGTLNSIENNEFDFNSMTLQRLKIIIHNQDNEALTFGSIEVNGVVHELVARFTESANYFLTYGNKKGVRARYDIGRFRNKIPKTLTEIKIGDEQTIKKAKTSVIEPIFKNEYWLWAIMILIILLLGWFSLMMIRKK